VRALRERGLIFPALVLLAVAAVLLQGVLRREPPPQALEEGPPAPPPTSFRPDLEKTPLAYESDYWLQLAERARDNLVLIGPERLPGVLIAPGLAIASIRAADEVARADRQRRAEAEQVALAAGAAALSPSTEPGAQGPAEDEPTRPPPGPRLVSVDVRHQLALFTVRGSSSPAFMTADPARLRSGTFIAAVTLAPDGSPRITPGHLVSPAVGGGPGSDPFEVSILFPPSMSMAAIIDMDGDLIGLAVESANGVHVLSARTALAAVGRMGGEQACQAIEVGNLDETVLKLLGVRAGVGVERVVPAAFPADPPIQAGDVLLRWNDRDVETAEEFVRLYSEPDPGSAVRVRLLRGLKRITAQLRMPRPDCRPTAEPLVHFPVLGLTVEWVELPQGSGARGWDVLAVRERSLAATAGFVPADLITGVDGRALARATARDPFMRFERQPRPMLVTIRRDARVKLVAVTPSDD